MKKLMIIAPALLITPILVGCNNKNAYSFVFNSDYCTLDNKSEYSKNEPETVTLTMKLKDEYKYCAVPDDVIVLIGRKEGKKGEDYTYEVINNEAKIKLTVNDNIAITAKFSDSDNAFRIDPNKFDEAINLTNVKYVQRAYMYMMEVSSYNMMIYQENYASPTVFNNYTRRIESGHGYEPDERYVEKSGDKYYGYYRDTMSSPWRKEDAYEADFIKPSNLSIKYLVVDLGNITYNLIQNKFVKETQSYEFETTTTKGDKYDVIMSFYNNKVTFLSYYCGSETSNIIDDNFGMLSFTYREITPTLPKVN